MTADTREPSTEQAAGVMLSQEVDVVGALWDEPLLGEDSVNYHRIHLSKKIIMTLCKLSVCSSDPLTCRFLIATLLFLKNVWI